MPKYIAKGKKNENNLEYLNETLKVLAKLIKDSKDQTHVSKFIVTDITRGLYNTCRQLRDFYFREKKI